MNHLQRAVCLLCRVAEASPTHAKALLRTILRLAKLPAELKKQRGIDRLQDAKDRHESDLTLARERAMRSRYNLGRFVNWGVEGTIYELRGRPDVVVKHIGPGIDVSDARKLQKESPAGVLRILGVKSIGADGSLIYMERLFPLSDRDHELLETVLRHGVIHSVDHFDSLTLEPVLSDRSVLREMTPNERRMAKKLRSLLRTVHSAGYAHRDIGAKNIMQDAAGSLKLIDVESSLQRVA